MILVRRLMKHKKYEKSMKERAYDLGCKLFLIVL